MKLFSQITAMFLIFLFSFASLAQESNNRLVGQWKLDEGKGKIIKDSSGNNHNGTFSGSRVKGDFGSAILFENDYVDFPAYSSLDINKANFTLDFWILPEKLKPTGKQKYFRLLSAMGKNSLFVIDLKNEGKPQLSIGRQQGGKWFFSSLIAKNKLKLKRWSYLTIICNRKNNKFILYINGIKNAELILNDDFKNISFSNYILNFSNRWYGFAGLLRNVELNLYCKSEEEIKKQYGKGETKVKYKLVNNPATIPQKRLDWSTGCAENLRKQAHKGNIDLLFLGDSIMALWGKNNKWANGAKFWDKYYKPLKAANFGIPADMTDHLLWRITAGEELEGIKPKAVVLLIGTNNLERPGDPDSTLQIFDGIKTIVQTIKQKLPNTKTLLLAIFPRMNKNSYYRGEQVDKINDLLPELADWQQVYYLDIGKKLLHPDGTYDKTIFRDGLHLSEKGYQIWAESMNPYLFDMLNNNGKGEMWNSLKNNIVTSKK